MKVTWLACLLALGLTLDLVSARTISTVKYAVMFDAGSSGTRCKVYKLQTRHSLRISDVSQIKVPKPNKATPGLSFFGDSPSGVGPYLQPLIDAAINAVPSQYQSQAPVYVFATAGMRLLQDNKRAAVIRAVEQMLSNSSKSPFLFQTGNIKVISGKDEAIYDWVTVNFLMGVLTGESSTEYGALEMGGASSQNAFEVPVNQLHTAILNLRHGTRRLYAHSYLGYGESEARKKLNRFLVNEMLKKDSNAPSEFVNPCFNSNFQKMVAVDGRVYFTKGGFHRATSSECRSLIKKVFFCRDGDTTRCPFKLQPRLQGKFYSFSVFTYALRDTGVVSTNGQRVSLENIKDVLVNWCSRPLTVVELNNPYTPYQCFQLNFIYSMLTDGYRVDDSFELYNGDSIHGFDLNWALGATLIALNAL